MSGTTSAPHPSSTARVRRRRGLTLLVAGAACIGLAGPAMAVTVTMGNAATDRATVDSWTNSVTVDTNHPAAFDGYFTEIEYFAERPGQMRFVIVDSAKTVTWVSETVTVEAAGVATLQLDAPVGVTAGSNLGVNTIGAPTISYDYDASAPPIQQTYGGGLVAVGDLPAFWDPASLFQPNRVYSMNADVQASSPQICKNGGWEAFGYKNQGQCIASVVANDNSGH